MTLETGASLAVTVQGSFKLFVCIKIDPHDEEILYLVPISIYEHGDK